MSAWITRARQAANLARLSSPKSAYSTPQSATVIHRRGLANGGHGTGTTLSYFHNHQFISLTMIAKNPFLMEKIKT